MRLASRRISRSAAHAVAAALLLATSTRGAVAQRATDALRFSVTFPAARSAAPIDGRLLVLISADTSGEPRSQVSDNVGTAQVFGVDVDGWKPGEARLVDASAFGYPVVSLPDLPRGRYRVQALVNRYETFRRSDGHTVKLPPDRGEGQQWSSKPGNLYSGVQTLVHDGGAGARTIALVLDREIPPVADFAAKQTKYVKYLKLRSERLSKFWGRDVELGAWVLLPEGFDSHPGARYPVVVNHGHFPAEQAGFSVRQNEEPIENSTAPPNRPMPQAMRALSIRQPYAGPQ